MTLLAKLFHLLAVAHFYFGVYYHAFQLDTTALQPGNFGGCFIYMTVLNFILQAVYFTIALVNDFVGSNKVSTTDRPSIRKVRDYIFGTFAFPLAFDVGVMFWLLYGIDRELVFPKILDAVFPWWFNHSAHTNIMAFVLIEMVLLHHNYPSRKAGVAGLSISMIAYLGWIHIVYYKSNVWAYPVLAILNWPQRIGLYIFGSAMSVLFYFIGEYLNKIARSKSRLEKSSTVEKC